MLGGQTGQVGSYVLLLSERCAQDFLALLLLRQCAGTVPNLGP